MPTESSFIDLMRAIATDPAARGLADDAAVLEIGGEALIITHDMMVEGMHWLPDADPADVAWKLVAVNLSDLAAKGAEPLGVVLGFTLSHGDWHRKFAAGFRDALSYYAAPLLGGDTVGVGDAARAIGMTAFGRATCKPVPSRSGARPGDRLCVTGVLGDAAAGFTLIQDGGDPQSSLGEKFRRPLALLEEGKRLAPRVHAMMDVSDGLLLDASRMAEASGCGIEIDLSDIPLSAEFIASVGDTQDSRIHAASWGDDYQLLLAAAENDELPVRVTAVGRFFEGAGVRLRNGETTVPLPASLGYQHG